MTDAGVAAGSRGLAWLWLSAAVIALDQASKHLILAAFHPGQELVLAPFMSLVLAFNSGAAFSFLAGAAGWQRWLFVAIAIGASRAHRLAAARAAASALFCAGLALIVGGALGNLWDRLTLGHRRRFPAVPLPALVLARVQRRRQRDQRRGGRC